MSWPSERIKQTTNVISNVNTGEFFVTNSWSQDHGLGEDWVHKPHPYTRAVTIDRYYEGVVANEENTPVWKEIPNPQPEYQA